jgi:hypothetical protein
LSCKFKVRFVKFNMYKENLICICSFPSDHVYFPFCGFSAIRSADEWSKIMALFYYRGPKPLCLTNTPDFRPSFTIGNRVSWIIEELTVSISHIAEVFPFNNTFNILPLCKISKGNECIAPSIDYMQYDDWTATKSLQRTVWCVAMAWHGMVVIIENELSSRLHNYYGPSLCSSTVPLEALFHHFFLFP